MVGRGRFTRLEYLILNHRRGGADNTCPEPPNVRIGKALTRATIGEVAHRKKMDLRGVFWVDEAIAVRLGKRRDGRALRRSLSLSLPTFAVEEVRRLSNRGAALI